MTNGEFEALLADTTKRIVGDVDWKEDDDHSPSLEFRAEIASDPGWPLFVRGSYNPLASALSYTLIHRGSGRIYALDLGKNHHNPACDFVGDVHKHHWTEEYRDKAAYAPTDITAPVSNPVEVWRQFCVEACIEHCGVLHVPRPAQGESA